MKKDGQSLLDLFSSLPDPRNKSGLRHSLESVLLVTVLAVICGADDWIAVEEYGKGREDMLREFIPLPHGSPSDDTFRRVFMHLDSTAFEQLFMDWTQGLAGKLGLDLIAIDGKTSRHSYASAQAPHTALHMVSAWSAANHLVLGQLKVSEKKNEIVAIPKLLKMMCVTDAIVTIDAMGCQRKIADQIIDQGGDYILAVKENQSELLAEIEGITRTLPPDSEDQQVSQGHGRIETRNCKVFYRVDLIDEEKKWKGLTSVIQIDSSRQINGQLSREKRYYISSLQAGANTFNHAVRMHWGIENSLHWVLDIAFREDECRKRKGNSAENFSVVRRFALNLLKRDTSTRLGVKNKRLKAAFNHQYLFKVIAQGE